MPSALDWEREGRHWPHRERSRFVEAGGLRWHLQQWPAPHPGAAQLLLLHGSGSSTHSWRDLAPLLAPHFGLVAVDLPGHAFSGPARGDGASMEGIARSLAALLAVLRLTPEVVLGHSAGAAIAIRLCLQAQDAGRALPRCLISLNGALFPLPGLAGSLFSPAAKLLSLNPLVPYMFAWQAQRPAVVQRLLASTGSTIDAAGAALYRRLVAHPGHVAGALAMMARWDLPALAADLPRLRVPLHLVVGEADGTVPPADALRARALLPASTLTRLPGLGHLAHEEQPAAVAPVIIALAAA